MTNLPSSTTIEVLVSPQGSVSIKTLGFSGASCRDATRELERALGITGRETLLPEFYAPRRSTTGDQIQQGT
jgi:hypothetical protein